MAFFQGFKVCVCVSVSVCVCVCVFLSENIAGGAKQNIGGALK